MSVHDFSGALVVKSIVRAFQLSAVTLYQLFLFEMFEFCYYGSWAFVCRVFCSYAVYSVECNAAYCVRGYFEVSNHKFLY